MSPQPPRIELDQRRGWARRRAVVVCLTGILVIAASAAALALVVVGGVARFWTWLRNRSIEDAGIWGIATQTMIASAVVAIVVSFAIFFWWFWTGSADAVLVEVSAIRVDDNGSTQACTAQPSSTGAEVTAQRRTLNLLEELSIGLGRPVPELWVTHDPIPNALSIRSSSRRIVCTTTGVGMLSRDELEAMLAHELGHLWALDAQWVGSGMVALARGRRAGLILATAGSVMFFLLVTAAFNGTILWSSILFSFALFALGLICTPMLRRLEMSMRRHADEIADVAAIKLARNPGSLAALCARLAEEEQGVVNAAWRSELMWFEMVEAEDLAGETDPEAPLRTRRELVTRAVSAYAQAREPVPEELQQRFDDWTAQHGGVAMPVTPAPVTPTPATKKPALAPKEYRKRQRQHHRDENKRAKAAAARQGNEPRPPRQLP